MRTQLVAFVVTDNMRVRQSWRITCDGRRRTVENSITRGGTSPRRWKNRDDTRDRDRDIGTRSIYLYKKRARPGTRNEKGGDKKKKKGNTLKETCAMCSVHVTERKKYQSEYIRENVQHIAREKMYGRKYATYPVFACLYEKEREKVQRTEYDGKRNGEEGKKYQGSGSKVFQPHECFVSSMLLQRQENGAARRAINKNLYRETANPERCISVRICVSHRKCIAWGSLQYFHILWKYRYFAFDSPCF